MSGFLINFLLVLSQGQPFEPFPLYLKGKQRGFKCRQYALLYANTSLRATLIDPCRSVAENIDSRAPSSNEIQGQQLSNCNSVMLIFIFVPA